MQHVLNYGCFYILLAFYPRGASPRQFTASRVLVDFCSFKFDWVHQRTLLEWCKYLWRGWMDLKSLKTQQHLLFVWMSASLYFWTFPEPELSVLDPNLWTRAAQTISGFKSLLKTHLFYELLVLLGQNLSLFSCFYCSSLWLKLLFHLQLVVF